MDALRLDQAEVIRSTGGIAWLWCPTPRMLVTRVVGALTAPAEMAIRVAMRRQITEGKYEGFHDWEHMTDYDAGARVRLTEALREPASIIHEVHILTISKIVAFGVQAAIANAPLTNLRLHPTRESFESTLDAALKRHGYGLT